MAQRTIYTATLATVLTGLIQNVDAACKCLFGDRCWPSDQALASLNNTLSGNLIRTVPVAAPCYPGPHQDAEACAFIQANFHDSAFHAKFLGGYDFPHEWSCHVPGRNSSTCSLGDTAVYSINATAPAAISAGLKFAARYNIRVSVKQSGHDLLGRSSGRGGLLIWTHYLRDDSTKPLEFNKTYVPTESCASVQLGGASYWGGSAARIGGGFTWGDVYPAAHENGVVVVGGTCPTVGIIGGYLQGGGHGAAMHEYGLGSDQILEFNVVLADGSKVLASPCSNPDLFRALRGGGPSTYGIVTSATVRTYPETPMVALILQIIPQEGTDDLDAFLDTITTWYQQIPALLDEGVQGYAGWAAWDGKSSLGLPSRMLQQAAGVFNQTLEQVQRTMEPIMDKLTLFKSRGIDVSLTGLMHHDAEQLPVYQDKNTSAVVDMTGGGAATKDLPLSGVNPVFRRALLINIVSRNWDSLTPYVDIAAAQKDVTYHKGKAQVAFAPDTGSYLNEGNWLDTDYLTNQFGAILPTLEAAKKKYDPTDLFYCPTCVGSQHWKEEEDGHLCTVKGSWWPFTRPVDWAEEL
ncbi:hypothetical protein J3F84DRAFT_406766 [Trichoderma pleuroticola]